jgi:hypothetical protein
LSKSIFDTNVSKNFLLTGHFHLIPKLCPDTRYLPATVYEELVKGQKFYARQGAEDSSLVKYALLFADLDKQLKASGFVKPNILQSSNAEEKRFFSHLIAEDRIDPGEIECFALAAYRGFTLYSDDKGLHEEVQAFNSGTSTFRGNPPHRPLEIHSTIWLLIKAVETKLLDFRTAGILYDEMRFELKSRLPPYPLNEIIMERSVYW